jgi:hypothetical protein
LGHMGTKNEDPGLGENGVEKENKEVDFSL